MPTPANQVEALDCPLRSHWVSFRVVNEHAQGSPYAGLSYQLHGKEGQIYTGTLDNDGFARADNLFCGVLRLDLSTPCNGASGTWYEELIIRPEFKIPLTALQVAAEQSPFGPRHNGQTYLAKERAVAEGAKFFRVEVSDFVEAAAHLPDPDSGWAPRPPKLKNATDQQQLGVDLEPNRHHVLEVKALRAYRPLLSRDKAFCALNAYHLAVMSTFVYAPFSKEAPFGTPYQSAPPPYKEPGSIGHVLREGLSCGKRPTQFNTAGPYHLLYEEVPYSKRLEAWGRHIEGFMAASKLLRPLCSAIWMRFITPTTASWSAATAWAAPSPCYSQSGYGGNRNNLKFSSTPSVLPVPATGPSYRARRS